MLPTLAWDFVDSVQWSCYNMYMDKLETDGDWVERFIGRIGILIGCSVNNTERQAKLE